MFLMTSFKLSIGAGDGFLIFVGLLCPVTVEPSTGVIELTPVVV
jgi:hypothetical protein